MKRLFFTLALFTGGIAASFAQCCGGCTPIGGNVNLGTLPHQTLQVNSYYKYSYSEGYTENDHRSGFNFVKNAYNAFTGLQLGYGLTDRLTLDGEIGYYLDRTQNFQFNDYKFVLKGSGISSITLSARYSVYKDTARGIEFTFGAGGRIPWSRQPQVVDGVELSEDVQPCNGAYGAVLRSYLFKEFKKRKFRLFLMNTVNINGTNPKHYREGNTYITAFFFSKNISKKWSVIAQLRNEVREHAFRDDALVVSSGGTRFVLVPQLNYNIYRKWNLSALYELPLYQYYYGIQLTDRYSFSLNLNCRFGIGKHEHDKCEAPK